jgi:peroxiredoxin (alkyl hydroperoxide reductase subunit C)
VDLGVDVYTVSVDSHFVHKVWEENELSKMVEGGIPFPMLSDQGGKIGSIYGVYSPENGVDVRGRFIIDPDGIVQAIEILTPPVGRNVLESLRQIKAFQLVRETEGAEATPSGWEPGKPTLKPGPDLVGRVWEAWKVENAF